jgi:tetratricopeptide (TPR) repeat protein
MNSLPVGGRKELEVDHRKRLMSRRILLFAAALAVLTVIVYLPSLRNQFVNYDDPAYVVANQHVLHGLSWKNVVWAFSSTAEANWHPLTWLSHMADVQLFRLNPEGHHLTNLLLHLCNVLLLFWILRAATGSILGSAVVAALFAVHPLNVESVAWIAERKSLLSLFFMLLAFLAWGKYVRRKSLAWYFAVIFLFALALMAKPMAITFPFLLLLADYWPLERIGVRSDGEPNPPLSRLCIEKIPLFVMSGLSAAVTLYAQRAAGALGSAIALPLKWRINNAVYSYLLYLIKAVWPSKLAVFYPHPENRLAFWKVALAGALVLAITGVVWVYRRRRYLLVGWLWFLGTLFPVIGIVQVGRQAWADRYAYIPLIGIFVLVTWLVADLLSNLKISRPLLATAVVVVVLSYASISYRQIHYWRNSYTLFSHAFEVTSNNTVAEDNLGEALVELGRPELALEHFEAAERIAPAVSTPHYNLGTLFQLQGKSDQAAREYSLVFRCSSDPTELAQTHNNLGALLMQSGKASEAKTQFDAALSIDPNKFNSLLGRGLAEYNLRELDDALQDFLRASHIQSSQAALFWIGRVLEDEGKLREASHAYEQALQIAPNMSDARLRLESLRSERSSSPQK